MSLSINKLAEAPYRSRRPLDTFGKWMRHWPLRYGFAMLAVAAAAGLRHLLAGFFGSNLPYGTFYPVIMLVAVIGGFGPGLLATLLSVGCADYLFLEPFGQFGLNNASDALGLAVFSAIGLWISALAGAIHRMRERYAQAREATVLESTTDAFFALDREWRFSYVNAALERILGCRREDLLGRGIRDCFPGGVGLPFQQVLEKAMAGGVAVHDEVQYPPTKAWYEVHAYPSAPGLSVYLRDIGDRKRAEEALRESAAGSARAQRLARFGNWKWDLITNEVYWSDEVYRILGLEPREIDASYEAFLERVHPDDRNLILNGVDSTLQRGAPYNVDHRIVLPDGTVKTANAQAEVVYDGSGKPIQFLGTLLDITERKRAERQMEESRARLASIVELAMDAIITVDAEQRIVLFNPAAERMFGCPAAEAIGGSMERFIPERFREVHRRHMRRLGETGASSRAMGAPGSLSALRANGEEFPMEASISRVEVGGRQLFTVILRDITERQWAEAALRESEERFRAMADSVPVLIWLSGTDKACTWFNQPWRDFTGRSLEQELGNGWAEGVHRDDLERCLSIYTESFDRRAPFEMEYRLRRADGEYRWIVDQGVPRFGPDSAFLGYVGSAIDITERKQAEDALREADCQKDEFLAMLAHELRNPLAPIRNAVQVMWRLDPPDPKLRWAGEVIDRQVHHLTHLVDDLLDVSRLIRGKILLRKEPVELAAIVHQAIETGQPLIDARKHRLTLSLPPESVWLQGDPVRLTQVLLNLLNNAAKYTHEGGRIWLEAERVGSEVVIRVRDTGMGIPATLLPRIFDLFTQAEQSLDRAQGGLGIGLTLVQRLVRLHGGRVEVRSEGPGRGAEFSVWLPVLAEPASAEVRESGEPSIRSLSATCPEPVVADNLDVATS